MTSFIGWLYASPVSHLIQTVKWIIPLTQVIHIVTLSVLFTSMLLLDLRLIGIIGKDFSIEYCAKRFLPWLWGSLPIMLATGVVLIIAEPGRDLRNFAFYTKMLLIILASIMSYIVQRSLKANPWAWEAAGRSRTMGRLVGTASLLAWIGIIFAGRLIAYV